MELLVVEAFVNVVKFWSRIIVDSVISPYATADVHNINNNNPSVSLSEMVLLFVLLLLFRIIIVDNDDIKVRMVGAVNAPMALMAPHPACNVPNCAIGIPTNSHNNGFNAVDAT